MTGPTQTLRMAQVATPGSIDTVYDNGPALAGDQPVARVDADRDLSGKRLGGFLHEGRIAHCRRSEDHARNAGVQPALDAVHVANAAAELHRRLHHVENGGHRIVVHRMPCEGAVEIDNVQGLEPHRRKAQRLVGGIVVERGRAGHLPAQQADAHTVLEVDRGIELHVRAPSPGVLGKGPWMRER